MNTVNMSQLKLQKHSIFFATACSMLLHPLNLLLTNALSAPLWNMPVQFCILILLKTSMLWNLFSVELPVGLPIAGGFLHLTVGVSSSDECIQALKWPTIQQRHTYFTICCIHDSLNYKNSLPFSEHFQLSQAPTRCHPLSIQPVTSSINSFRYSFFVNNPFLWNTIPHTILQIKQPPLFRLALRCFSFLNLLYT